MKLTKSKLKQIIKEELQKVLNDHNLALLHMQKVLNENKPADKDDPLVKEAIDNQRYYVKRASQYDDRTGPGGAPERDKGPYAAEYTIQKGDSLWKIAKKKLGDSKKWENLLDDNELLAADPPLHGKNKKDGSPKIRAGWKLHIPDAI